MRNVLLLVLLLFSASGHAQMATLYAHLDPYTDDTAKILNYVEQMPAPQYSLVRYLQLNLHYPKYAKDERITGRVIVKFYVTENGYIRGCQVVRGFDDDCDREAIRLIRMMPRWRPGMQRVPGTHVFKKRKVWFSVPIVFKLT